MVYSTLNIYIVLLLKQRHRDTKTQEHKDTGTQRHRDTGHRDTVTQGHSDTKTQYMYIIQSYSAGAQVIELVGGIKCSSD